MSRFCDYMFLYTSLRNDVTIGLVIVKMTRDKLLVELFSFILSLYGHWRFNYCHRAG